MELVGSQTNPNSQPPVPILSQVNSFQAPHPFFLNTYFNIILPRSLGLPSSLFLWCFLTTTLYYLSYPPTRATSPSHLIPIPLQDYA